MCVLLNMNRELCNCHTANLYTVQKETALCIREITRKSHKLLEACTDNSISFDNN